MEEIDLLGKVSNCKWTGSTMWSMADAKPAAVRELSKGTVVVMSLEILEHITIAPNHNNFIARSYERSMIHRRFSKTAPFLYHSCNQHRWNSTTRSSYNSTSIIVSSTFCKPKTQWLLALHQKLLKKKRIIITTTVYNSEYLGTLETIGSLQQIPQPSVWGSLVIGNGHPWVSSPPIKIH